MATCVYLQIWYTCLTVFEGQRIATNKFTFSIIFGKFRTKSNDFASISDKISSITLSVLAFLPWILLLDACHKHVYLRVCLLDGRLLMVDVDARLLFRYNIVVHSELQKSIVALRNPAGFLVNCVRSQPDGLAFAQRRTMYDLMPDKPPRAGSTVCMNFTKLYVCFTTNSGIVILGNVV